MAQRPLGKVRAKPPWPTHHAARGTLHSAHGSGPAAQSSQAKAPLRNQGKRAKAKADGSVRMRMRKKRRRSRAQALRARLAVREARDGGRGRQPRQVPAVRRQTTTQGVFFLFRNVSFFSCIRAAAACACARAQCAGAAQGGALARLDAAVARSPAPAPLRLSSAAPATGGVCASARRLGRHAKGPTTVLPPPPVTAAHAAAPVPCPRPS